MKTRITIILAALFAAFLSTVHAGPPGIGYGSWMGNHGNRIEPSEGGGGYVSVARDCTHCLTVGAQAGKTGMYGFRAPSTHACPGCKGTISVGAPTKGGRTAEYRHTCSICGSQNTFTCANHGR